MTEISAATSESDRHALEALYELTAAVARAVALEDVCREAVRVIRSAVGVDRAALLIVDEGGVMRFRAWEGLSDTYRARTEGHSPWATDETSPMPVVIEDISEDESLAELRDIVTEEGIAALTFIPIVGPGGLLGKFMLYSDSPRVFADDELMLASMIAASVAVAIGRREIEARLRASRDQLAAIFSAVADGITVLDRGGRFVLANDAAAKLCGFEDAKEMLSAPPDLVIERFQILDEDGEPLDLDALPARRVLAGEPYAERVVRYRRHGDDDDRWSHVKAAPVPGPDDEPEFAVNVFRDITNERREHERSQLAFTRISRLERLADAALRASTLDELLEELLVVVRSLLGSDRATMLLLGPGNELIARAAVGIDPDVAYGVRVPVGEGIAGTIAATRAPTIIDDLSKEEVVSAYLREHGGSLAGVPLLFQNRLLGVMHVSSDETSAFDAEDLEYLKLAAERAAIAIEQTRIFERERDIAAALQQSLLPEHFPPLPGVVLAASYLPASDGARVGGDWYDAFPLGDGRILVAIGDIVGHGIQAASAMGQVRNALRAYANEEPSPASIFTRINTLLSEAAGNLFCTAFCGVIDPWARTITYSDAGHPATLVLNPRGEASFLEGARSTPLGALRNARYDEQTETLEPGAIVVAYTDGLVESRREPIDARLDALADAASAAANLPPARITEFVESKLVDDGEREDDVAMIVVQLTASPDELRLRLPAEPDSLRVVRGALDGYTRRIGGSDEDVLDLKVACCEACSNVIEHAYGTGTGAIRLKAAATDGGVVISVTDAGRWREHHPRGASRRGHGLTLMRALVDDVEITTSETAGTEVRLFRRIGG
jgi:PAS domain S-box-containing protein